MALKKESTKTPTKGAVEGDEDEIVLTPEETAGLTPKQIKFLMNKKKAEARLGMGRKSAAIHKKSKGKKKKKTPGKAKVQKPKEPELSKEEKNNRRRKGTIMELIQSEKNYLDKIQAMHEHVAIPIVEAKVIT